MLLPFCDMLALPVKSSVFGEQAAPLGLEQVYDVEVFAAPIPGARRLLTGSGHVNRR